MSSPFQQQFSTKSPLNQISPKLKKRGRVLHEHFYGEELKNVNTLNQTSVGDITVEDADWKNKKS